MCVHWMVIFCAQLNRYSNHGKYEIRWEINMPFKISPVRLMTEYVHWMENGDLCLMPHTYFIFVPSIKHCVCNAPLSGIPVIKTTRRDISFGRCVYCVQFTLLLYWAWLTIFMYSFAGPMDAIYCIGYNVRSV